MTTNGTNQTNAMTEIQQTTLDRAIKLLNALPLQYAIRTEDGREFGALPIAAPADERADQAVPVVSVRHADQGHQALRRDDGGG